MTTPLDLDVLRQLQQIFQPATQVPIAPGPKREAKIKAPEPVYDYDQESLYLQVMMNLPYQESNKSVPFKRMVLYYPGCPKPTSVDLAAVYGRKNYTVQWPFILLMGNTSIKRTSLIIGNFVPKYRVLSHMNDRKESDAVMYFFGVFSEVQDIDVKVMARMREHKDISDFATRLVWEMLQDGTATVIGMVKALDAYLGNISRSKLIVDAVIDEANNMRRIDPLEGKVLHAWQSILAKALMDEQTSAEGIRSYTPSKSGDDRKITCIWDPIGRAGKSQAGQHIGYHLRRNCIYWQDFPTKPGDAEHRLGSEIMNLWTGHTFIMDLPRGREKALGFYPFLEKIKNGQMESSKYQGGKWYIRDQEIKHTNIVILSNEAPLIKRGLIDEKGNPHSEHDTLTPDRWNIFVLYQGKLYAMPYTYLETFQGIYNMPIGMVPALGATPEQLTFAQNTRRTDRAMAAYFTKFGDAPADAICQPPSVKPKLTITSTPPSSPRPKLTITSTPPASPRPKLTITSTPTEVKSRQVIDPPPEVKLVQYLDPKEANLWEFPTSRVEVKWYGTLVPGKNEGKSLLENIRPPLRSMLVAKDMQYKNGKISKNYALFNDYFDFLSYANGSNLMDRCYYEIIDGKQKPYMDIDSTMKGGNLDPREVREGVEYIIRASLEIRPQMKREDVIVLSSNALNNSKQSYHLMWAGWYFDCHEANKSFFVAVKHRVPEKYHYMMDESVYTHNRQFRVLGSHKFSTVDPRTLSIDPMCSWKPDENAPDLHYFHLCQRASLVSNVHDCKPLPPFGPPSPEKKHVTYGDLDARTVDEVLKYVMEKEGIKDVFTPGPVTGSIIPLKRERPSECLIKHKEGNGTKAKPHEHEHAYLLVGNDKVFFSCRRGKGDEEKFIAL